MYLNRKVFRAAVLVSLLAAFLAASDCCSLQRKAQGDFLPQPGDLLFQDMDGSPFCDAVEKVTRGYNGANLTHVGMVARDESGNVIVLEAVQQGVTATPLQEFLDRSHDANQKPKVIVGRLKTKYQPLVQTALAYAFELEGKPYDSVFDLNNDAYYCSELVYICFKNANSGKPVFEISPMTFIDPDTQETFPIWTQYFEDLGVPIPEGKPGLNPGGISRSKALRIIHLYGIPDGWIQ